MLQAAAARRDTLVAMLREHLAGEVTFTAPPGGVAV